MPCIVAQLSDADADIMMAETNIQRPDWLPSERAKIQKCMKQFKPKRG